MIIFSQKQKQIKLNNSNKKKIKSSLLINLNKMLQGYFLKTDSRQIQSLNSVRVLVAAALLYTFTMHFVFTGIAYFFKDDVKIQRVYDHGRRLVFYGIAAILSMNFLQYGVYHAVCAWVLLILTFVLHSMSLMRQVKENYQNIGVCLYYFVIAAWYFGIIFFFFYNAFN